MGSFSRENYDQFLVIELFLPIHEQVIYIQTKEKHKRVIETFVHSGDANRRVC